MIHHALGPHGLVWLERSGERTAVWWIEAGRDSSRRIAVSVGMPDGIVAHEGGVYWGTADPEYAPDNEKVMVKANGRVFSARLDGGLPIEVVHGDRHTHPRFADSGGVAWYEIGFRPAMVRVFEATVAGVAETMQSPLVMGEDDHWG